MRTLITCTLLLKIIVLMLVKILYAVPPDYCLQNLNKSDCSVSPINVFSYYKPGSRCELEVWRGCPTYNLFRTESACVNMCIKRKSWSTDKEVTKFDNGIKLNVKCHGPVNINKCNSNAIRAFVYNTDTNECDEIVWTGCQHKGNVFEEQLDCLQTCYRGDLKWHEKINMIPNNLAKELDTILDKISLNGDEAKIKLLLHKTGTKNDSYFTKKTVKEKILETTPTTEKHVKNGSYSTATNSSKIAENITTKALDKTKELLNYLLTTKYLVTTKKFEYPKTTTQTTQVESATPEATTTTTEATSSVTTTTTKTTTSTTIKDTTPDFTTLVVTTPEVTTPEATTSKTITSKTTPTETTTTEATASEATTSEATISEATTSEATTSEATTTEATTATTVKERTTVKTTTVNTGTAKEVVLPQDMY